MQPKRTMMGHNTKFDIPKEMGAWVLGDPDNIQIKKKPVPEPKEDDGFLKFVADSRNWAYAYIENVQAGIWNFKQKVGNHIEYFDEFGSVMETPLHPAMRDISSAYKELIKFIPDDYGKIE